MDTPASYRTVKEPASGEYKEKGSKFLGFVYPVSSESDVKERLEELRKEFYDARHHCYAYILGNDGELFRANDDGEPGHSAGDPILGQLRSENLTNVLAVVVRYFGGTKLGVSGLIHAYKTAAAEAIKAAPLVRRQITRSLELKYPYDSTNEVMRLIDEFDLTVLDQQFEMDCLLKGKVNIHYEEALKRKIDLLNSTGTELTLTFTEDTPA